MTSTSNNDYNTTRSSLGDLEAAIKTLEKFSVRKKSSAGSFIEEKLNISTTIRAVGQLVLGAFSKKRAQLIEIKEDQVQKELQSAIETLKNHYPLIDQLQNGSASEQKLATLALETISTYNQRVERIKSPSWSQTFADLLFKNNALARVRKRFEKIPLPFKARIQTEIALESHLGEKLIISNDTPTELSAHHFTQIPNSPSLQEQDMFCMKFISLLEKSEITVSREEIKKTPIKIEECNGEKGEIALYQKISVLPGENLELQGLFRRYSKSAGRSLPVQDSFHLSSQSTQTGFPHPSQHTGWALADQLLPAYPHRLDLLPNFSELQRKKNELAITLLPKGCFNSKAKKILKFKKEAFNADRELFIEQHRQLAIAIANASSDKISSGSTLEAINRFYDALKAVPNAFEQLTETQQTIMDIFVTKPYKKVLDERLNNPEFKSAVKSGGYHVIEELLKSESDRAFKAFVEEKKSAPDAVYIECMGDILRGPSHFIILQELSEILEFAPPFLDEFERKIQASVYHQVSMFIDEVNVSAPSLEEIRGRLLGGLQADIDLFELDSIDQHPTLPLVINELEEYFNSRYYIRQQRPALQ